jgi:hypothetical protein
MQAAKKMVDVESSVRTPAAPPSPDRTRKAKGMRGDLMITLGPGEADRAALKSVVTEWLVPLLVQQFFEQHEPDRELSSKKLSTEPRGKEGAVNSRIR